MRITFKMQTWLHAAAASFGAVIGLASLAGATVFYSRDEALHVAFPSADRTEARDFFLTPEQRAAIEKSARSALDSDLITVYVGWQGDRVLGYAIFDTHVVRTLPETFLTVLSPEGKIAATYVVAFYEPLEYLPSDRWLHQVEGKGSGDDLQVGHGIAAITGSTLSSNAVMGGVRRSLAIYAVLLAPQA
jgi:hypothetical protein